MISVIIPTFGSFKRVSKLLNSIQKYEPEFAIEVFVINDDPQTRAPNDFKYTVLTNPKNLGFAASVNRGLEAAKGDVLLLLNDDIVWVQPTLKRIEEFFEKDAAFGILGGMLWYPGTKKLQHAGMQFDPKTKSFYHIKQKPKSGYMICVTGAFFAITRACYNNVGKFDEKYFLACEDTDYCLRAWEKGFDVYLDTTIQAIHEEGATRGKTIQEKKNFKTWTQAEQKGIASFRASLDVRKITLLRNEIRHLNNGPLKVEVGSGYNPQPGYKHLDIRKGLPQLDFVCDFTKDRLPFEDGEVDDLLANHVIEHIPFRKLGFVVSEWARVLKSGGKITLRTPNLRFICEKYLKGEMTPEWPGDEKYIKENFGGMTPSWWANLKLFSGQDYDANFHHVCFDSEMLMNLLAQYGFSHGGIVKLDKEYSPGEIQLEAYRGA